MPASLDPDRTEWDVIVIGGAPPGENVAQYATETSDLEAVIVEAELVGGECSFWACMPSKGLLRPVEVFEIGQHVEGVRQALEGRTLDAAAVLAHRDSIVNDHDDQSQVDWATSNDIDVIRGYARLAGEKTVKITKPDGSVRTITARQAVVIDSGSSASVPGLPGMREANPWISRDVTNLHVVPRRAIVIGGGVVGCEAATWLAGLGVAELTVIAGSLLARNEPFAGELVADALRERGVRLLLGSKAASVSRVDVDPDAGVGELHGGEVTVTLDDGTTVVADELIVAAGRHPNSTDIGLATVGLHDRGGPIGVDDHFSVEGVNGTWLYAVGDVCGRAQLTHMGKYQARICGEVIASRAAGLPLDTGPFSRHVDHADHDQVPQVTFTHPEVGSVGLSEKEARGAGLPVETVEYDMASLAGTYLLRDGYVGRAKLIIDSASDTLLGATFVGTEIADLVHAATIAVVGKVPLAALWHAVPSYPTPSEIWLRLLETLHTQRRPQAE